jgi:hypothetical protein
MLGRLSGAFSMNNMGGAGAAYAQNIRDYNAPVLDANDEESLLARQRWAQSNGYQDEASQLGVKLGQLGAANQLKAETDDKNARLANMFGNAIPGLPENLQDIARGMRDGLATGDVEYMEAVEWLQNPTSATETSNRKSTTFKDGSSLEAQTQGPPVLYGSDGKTYKFGDPGYKEALSTARDSGIVYANDIAAATTDGERGVGGAYDAFTEAETMYGKGMNGVQDLTWALEDITRAETLIDSGELNTGEISGRIGKIFGGEAVGEVMTTGTDKAIDYLMKFSGPTTDFEFTKAEAAAFVDLLKNEDINKGKLKAIKRSLERQMTKAKGNVNRGYSGMTSYAKDNKNLTQRLEAATGAWGSTPNFIDPDDPESLETQGQSATDTTKLTDEQLLELYPTPGTGT